MELILYDSMCRAIDAAYRVDEVKEIHDKAVALEHYQRLARNVEAEDRCYEIRWRAAARAGELLAQMEKAQGRRTDLVAKDDQVSPLKTLAELGITKQQSSDWQKLAAVAHGDFERAIAGKAVRSLIEKPFQIEGEALLLYGMILDFENRWLKESPQFFMTTMTAPMLECVRRVAPFAAEWLARI